MDKYKELVNDYNELVDKIKIKNWKLSKCYQIYLYLCKNQNEIITKHKKEKEKRLLKDRLT